MLAAAIAVVLVTAAPDYAGLFDKGVPFASFLADATALKDDWDATVAAATVDEASVARAQALTGTWRILVVAEDSCHDSLYTLPYLAKLADASPGTLSLHVVRKAVGLAVMEAHRTADGRAATPTIVVLDRNGAVKGVIVERPAALLEYSKEHSERGERRAWYVRDKGRHAVAELLDLIEK